MSTAETRLKNSNRSKRFKRGNSKGPSAVSIDPVSKAYKLGDKLRFKYDSSTGSVKSNYMDWYQYWENGIGKYHTDFKAMFDSKVFTKYEDDIDVKGLKLKETTPLHRDFFVPDEEQKRQLRALNDTFERDLAFKEMFAVWVDKTTSRNAKIKLQNLRYEAAVKHFTTKKYDFESVAKKTFVAILEDMDQDTIDKIKQFKQDIYTKVRVIVPAVYNENEEEIQAQEDREVINHNITKFKDAEDEGNFIFLFAAAEATHVKKVVNALDPVTQIQVQERHKMTLLSLKHVGGVSFPNHCRLFRDRLRIYESTGVQLIEFHKIVYFMDSLCPTLFKSILADWRSPSSRDRFKEFDTLDKMIDHLTAELVGASMYNPEIDRFQYDSKYGREGTFKSTEKSNDKPNNKSFGKAQCSICGQNHITDKCTHRDKDFTVEQNRNYYLRGLEYKRNNKKRKYDKSEESSQTSGSGQVKEQKVDNKAVRGTTIIPPVKPEGTNAMREWTVNDKYEDTRTVFSDDNEMILSSVVNQSYTSPSDEFTLIYDTGSEKGAVQPGLMDVLKDVHHNVAYVTGQGGATQRLNLAGVNCFGLFRKVPEYGNVSVISHAESAKNWKLIHLSEFHMQLVEWPHKYRTGKVWNVITDPDKYGDSLPRVVISRDEFPDLFKDYSEPSYSFYNPKYAPSLVDLSNAERERIEKVDVLHIQLNHSSGNAMKKLLMSLSDTSFTSNDIDQWQKYYGDFCSGCQQGKMVEHKRVPSTNKDKYSNVNAGTGDIMFVDQVNGKTPTGLHIDYNTRFVIGKHLKDRTVSELEDNIDFILGVYKSNGKTLSHLVYDRESAIVACSNYIQSQGVTIDLKAAGQKSGLIERFIRLIREHVRAVKASILDRYGYRPPVQWNNDLVMDTIGVLNAQIHEGQTMSPMKMFTGRDLDLERDLRVSVGDFVYVKKSKKIVSDLETTAVLGVVVRRFFNGSGVIKVYIPELKSMRHGLKFSRVKKIPERAINLLNSIGTNDRFRTETDEIPLSLDSPIIYDDVDSVIEDLEPISDPAIIDAIDTVEALAEKDVEQLEPFEQVKLLDAKDILNQVYEQEIAELDVFPVLDDTLELDTEIEPLLDSTAINSSQVESESFIPSSDTVIDQPEFNRETRNLFTSPGFRLDEMKDLSDLNHHREIRRSARLSQPEPEFDMSYRGRIRKPLKPLNIERFNILAEKHLMLFEQALKSRPEDARKALDKELDSAEIKKIWHGVLQKDLSTEDQKLIIDAMTNYVEKFHPTGDFDKSKVRVLVRGDQQWEFGDTESPVCRVECIFMIACIAALLDLEVFKMDVVSAYLNSPMTDEIKHKWILLPRTVARRLVERDPDTWRPFLRLDGKILVQMDKVMYGYKEAAIRWFLTFGDMFDEARYSRMPKDPCFLYKFGKSPSDMLLLGLSVDDSFGASTRNCGLKEELYALVRATFEGYTVEEGDEINVIGMHFSFDRVNKAVTITQKKFVNKIIDEYKPAKSSTYPSDSYLFEVDESSPLIKDQRVYMSKVASANYGAHRTYPMLLLPTSVLSSYYYKATEVNDKGADRLLNYISGIKDSHHMYLRPTSLNIVAYADASYAERASGHSQTGGCVGFEGVKGPCLFLFTSAKQSTVAKSSCEAELIAACTISESVVWLQESLEILGLRGDKVPVLYQDNKSTILIAEKGKGTFKRTKHIKVRYFWIHELITNGELRLDYIPTGNMIADILTKPLTGHLFHYFLEYLMGIVNEPNRVENEVDEAIAK